MKKMYVFKTCLLLTGMTTASFCSSELQKFEAMIPSVKFADEFLDSETHGKAGVMWRSWHEAFKKADMKYDEKNIKFIVLHYTASPTRKGVPGTFKQNGTSSHFLVDTDGIVVNYVDPYKGIAYHTGNSFYAGYNRLNYWSIGIEHSGLGNTSIQQLDMYGKPLPGRTIEGDSNYWYEFPEIQFQKSCELTKALQKEFNVPGFSVVTHADIAPGRKLDIGPMWNYKKAYDEYGVGFFPSETHQIDMSRFADMSEDDYVSLIGCIGYDTSVSKRSIIRAYQLHYSAQNISGVLVANTQKDILKHVIALAKNGKNGYFNKKVIEWALKNPEKVSAFAEYIKIG